MHSTNRDYIRCGDFHCFSFIFIFLAFYFCEHSSPGNFSVKFRKKIPVFNESRTHRNDLFGTNADENSLILYNSKSSEKNKTIKKI